MNSKHSLAHTIIGVIFVLFPRAQGWTSGPVQREKREQTFSPSKSTFLYFLFSQLP